jgi:hypothetical protein
MCYSNENVFPYPVITVIEAACAAHRVNRGYQKFTKYDYINQTQITSNKELMRLYLSTPDSVVITQDDKNMAINVYRYMKGLFLKVIAGETNEYIKALAEISQKSEIATTREIGLLASAPKSYLCSVERNYQETILRENNRPLQTPIGKREQFEIEVVRCNFSEKWKVHYVTAIVNNSTVFFSLKSHVLPGEKYLIKGTARMHYSDRTKLGKVIIVKKL